MTEESSAHVAYRAVLLAGALIVLGLLFQQLVTLMLAVLITVIIAIPLAAWADRLERRGIPRAIGALTGLLLGVGTIALVIALLIPPFIDETNQFVEDVPGIVDDLREQVNDLTGARPSEVGDRVQDFAERYTEEPERLIKPLTSIGLNVAGVLGALILILITAYFMAVRPQPLVEGLVRLVPPDRRDHALHIMDRLRRAWVGWMVGLSVDMLLTGVLLYVALTLIGLDFAVFFAVLAALLTVVPYFGAFAAMIPPTLFALTDSPGKALLVLGAYLLVQQIESNLTIPIVMSQTVRLHPAVIAIGVVLVGQVFGFVGLFVAVPILSLIVISVEELWVKQLEAADRQRGPPMAQTATETPVSGQLHDGDDGGDHDAHDDRHLHHDPEPR
jgi:predicted PurR-regulated permease PerM